MDYIGVQNSGPVTGQRRSVRKLVSSSLKVPIEKRSESIKSSIEMNKQRRKLDRDEPHEMVYHKYKVMKL